MQIVYASSSRLAHISYGISFSWYDPWTDDDDDAFTFIYKAQLPPSVDIDNLTGPEGHAIMKK